GLTAGGDALRLESTIHVEDGELERGQTGEPRLECLLPAPEKRGHELREAILPDCAETARFVEPLEDRAGGARVPAPELQARARPPPSSWITGAGEGSHSSTAIAARRLFTE